MSKFDERAKELELQVLNKKQLAKFLLLVHSLHSAAADRVAFNSEYLLIEGGNLQHYAGLEYDTPLEIYPKAVVSLYKWEGEDDNTKEAIEGCQETVKEE